MVLSMTGFGRGEARDASLAVGVEVKTVNHRYFESVVSLPLKFSELEQRLKARLRAALRRGHVECSVTTLLPVPGTREPVVDLPLAQRYLATLRSARDRLGLTGEPDLALLIGLPGVVRVEERPVHSERLARLVERALAEALRRVQAMRRAEGERLAADLRQRLLTIRGHTAAIRQSLVRRRPSDRARAKGAQPGEPAPASPRTDVTEELVRLGSHLTACLASLRKREPVGRRLDFLLQEMNREANTIGSKAPEIGAVHRAVAIKEELEKVREQVQNLE
jgi:uncharacterized protein (TIGR00255 family)